MDKTFIQMLRNIILKETIYLRHYIGKVLNIIDPVGKGRICCAVYDIGIDTESVGLWCYPRETLSLKTPSVGDYVEIYFMNGDRDRPVYIGIASEMKDMIPKAYQNERTQVIFDDKENKCPIVYSQDDDVLSIGKNGAECARKGDTTELRLSAIDIQNLAISLLSTTGFIPASAPIPATVPMPAITDGEITSGSSQVKVGNK